MGQSFNSTTGYGVLILQDDLTDEEQFYDLEECDAPEVLNWEPVGNLVLGKDEGAFYVTDDVTIQIKSATHHNEYVTEYPTYSVADDIKKHVETFASDLRDRGFVVRVGAFKAGFFG